MGNRTLFFTAQFGRGFPFGRDEEYRVVAEATRTGGLSGDYPRPAAVAYQRRGIFGMAQIDQHTVELRLTLVVRHVL